MKEHLVSKEERPIRLGYYLSWAAVLWSVLVVLSLIWNLRTERSGMLEAARIEARTAFEKDIVYRRWNSNFGGVYAPVTESTQPNPYLNVPERDITTTSGKKLTMINPAYMTRQVNELAQKAYGVKGHITSLDPIRPANTPDPWERRAMEQFKAGAEEVSSVENMAGEDYMRLMSPLITESGCLQCHAAQGYKLGDLRGGISVSIPMAPLMAISQTRIVPLVVWHGLLWLAGFVVIVFGTRRLDQQIRKRIETEKALRESEEKYRTQFEEAFDAIFVSEAETGILVDCNNAASVLVGRAKSDIVGKHQRMLHPQEEVEGDFSRTYKQHLEDKEGQTLDAQVITKNGEVRDVAIKANIFEIKGRRFLQGIFRDITERKRAEEALKKSEAEKASILDATSDLLRFHDHEMKILWANKASVESVGLSPEALLGRFCYEIWGKRSEPCPGCPIIETLKTGQTRESEVVNQDGAIWFHRGHPVLDEKGEVLGIVVSSVDITKRKRAEEALREAKEKYHSLYDNAPDMYFSVDAKTAKIIECNQTLINRLGYTRDEIIGRIIFDMYTPDSADIAKRNLFPEFVKTGKTEEEELQVKRKDGTTVDVYLKASAARDPEGNILYSISSWRDITELKRLQAQLYHAQKMESIGTLTSGVAHNFRNLLSPISLYAQLIQMTYKDNSQLQETAGKTIECVKRGAQLVDGLMQFSRRYTKELETINVAEMLQETYDLITKSFDKKIDIRMDIADSLPISGDRSGLSQVFMNLCTNARDAMPDGGELSIEARKKGYEALIAISDTGLGIDEQTRMQCFDPFFTTKDTDKGTGLGLSTTYGIVKDNGGDIQVFSELNKGTTFMLNFPLARSDDNHRRAGTHEIVQGSGEKILILDDEADILEVLVLLTEQLGYRVASANSGQAGIDQYKSWRPDVVLLDRNMPKMDGLKCARSILEYDPEARIVLISGYDEGGPSGIDRKTKALIKYYLTKPINMEAVSQTLRKVLDQD